MLNIFCAGTVALLAGSTNNGFIDGPISVARFDRPIGVAVTTGGVVFTSCFENNAVRMVSTNGIVSTIFGSTLGNAGNNNGFGTNAKLKNPFHLSLSTDNFLYVADDNQLIRRVDLNG